MPTQIVMDHTGDTCHQFDATDQAAVAEAEKRFIELTGAGFTAAKRTESASPQSKHISASTRRSPPDQHLIDAGLMPGGVK